MTIEVAGRAVQIQVPASGSAGRVEVGGRTTHAHLARTGSGWSLLVGADPVRMGEPARSHDVVIDRRRDRLLVVIDGKAIPVVVGRSPRAGGPRSPVVIGAEGGEAITAAMPGRVVKVLVRRGDAVSPGQPLVVVEAMKMQNELRATRAGIVTDVRVSEGAPVEARAILIVVGPAPDAY